MSWIGLYPVTNELDEFSTDESSSPPKTQTQTPQTPKRSLVKPHLWPGQCLFTKTTYPRKLIRNTGSIKHSNNSRPRCPQTLGTPTLVQNSKSTPPLCSPTREAPPFFGVSRAPKKDWHTPAGETDKKQLNHRRGTVYLKKSQNPGMTQDEDSKHLTIQIKIQPS